MQIKLPLYFQLFPCFDVFQTDVEQKRQQEELCVPKHFEEDNKINAACLVNSVFFPAEDTMHIQQHSESLECLSLDAIKQ